MLSMVKFSDGTYDGCELTMVGFNFTITNATIYVISRYMDVDVINETRWEYQFDLTNLKDGTEVSFGSNHMYSIEKQAQEKGGTQIDALFTFDNKQSRR